MSVSNNRVIAPVSFADVNQVLGTSHTDLGLLCKSTQIKMWAKYKPVRWANPMTTDALNSDKTWNTSVAENKKWWKATDGNYGLDISAATINVGMGTSGMITALNSLVNIIFNPNLPYNGWTYVKPNGNTNPYRLTDFNRYNHGATLPIRNVSVGNVAASTTSIYTVAMELLRTAVTNIDNRDYLIPEDITTMSLHLGFAIFKLSSNTYYPIAWVTDVLDWIGQGITYSDQSDGIIGDDGSKINTRLKDGATYYATPIFTTYTLAQPSEGFSIAPSDSNMKLIAVPGVALRSFTATRRSTTQTIGVPELSSKTISALWTYTTTLYINSTYTGYSGGNAQNVTLAVVNELYNGTPAQGNYAYYNNFGTVTVGSSEKKTVGSTGLLDLDPNHSWRVIVSINGEETTFSLITPAQPT